MNQQIEFNDATFIHGVFPELLKSHTFAEIKNLFENIRETQYINDILLLDTLTIRLLGDFSKINELIKLSNALNKICVRLESIYTWSPYPLPEQLIIKNLNTLQNLGIKKLRIYDSKNDIYFLERIFHILESYSFNVILELVYTGQLRAQIREYKNLLEKSPEKIGLIVNDSEIVIKKFLQLCDILQKKFTKKVIFHLQCGSQNKKIIERIIKKQYSAEFDITFIPAHLSKLPSISMFNVQSSTFKVQVPTPSAQLLTLNSELVLEYLDIIDILGLAEQSEKLKIKKVDAQHFEIVRGNTSVKARIEKLNKTYKINLADNEYIIEDLPTATSNNVSELSSESRIGEIRQKKDEVRSIYAPIPGKIVNIKAKVGTKVNLGDLLIVIESMKMQNEILSPVTGVVSNIYVEVGQTVEARQELVRIE